MVFQVPEGSVHLVIELLEVTLDGLLTIGGILKKPRLQGYTQWILTY